MMVDIRNMQAFALFLQKYDINFDLFSATKEMEKQVFIQSSSIVFVASPSTLLCTCSKTSRNIEPLVVFYYSCDMN